jgi:hypothetical protein
VQLPSVEEIEALLADRKQTAIVFFLDETFEELEYDATTTVLEAVEFLAGVIKLQNYQTFTLYECRKVHAYLHRFTPRRMACINLARSSSEEHEGLTCHACNMYADTPCLFSREQHATININACSLSADLPRLFWQE